MNVGGLNSGDLDSARKMVGGTSKGDEGRYSADDKGVSEGPGFKIALNRNVINVILGFFRDIAIGVWTGP